MGSMTPKQRRFVAEYLIDGNGTQAAIRAGYSKRTAEQIGYQLLQKTSVAEAIAEAEQKRLERVEIDQDYVLKGIKAEAEGYKLGAADPNPQAALRAYELLGRHLEMFTDKTKHSGEIKTDYVVRLPARAESARDWLEGVNAPDTPTTH